MKTEAATTARRIASLRKWVETNSGTFNKAGVEAMADHLETAMQGLPGTLERLRLNGVELAGDGHFDPGPALRLRFNTAAPVKVLFSGHMDTVYGADSPFQKVTDHGDGRLQGPGIADMKGGLLIMIEAVKAWTSTEAGAGIGGEILITPDEEIGSPCSQHLLQEAAAYNDLGLVFESALPGGELVANRKGTGTFRLIASGKAAHTGRDFAAGCNAIAGLADALLAIHQLNATEPEAIFNVGKVSGGGPVNIVPDRAEAFINIRTGSTTTAERIVPLLNDIIAASERRHPGLRLTLDGAFSRPPRNESPGCERLHALWNAAEQQLGLPPSGKRSTGGSSDGNVLAHHGLPHLDGVGVCGGNIHSHDEFAFAASIDAQINRTVAFLHQLSANPDWRNHSST